LYQTTIAFLTVALASVSALAQSPAQRGRGGGAPQGGPQGGGARGGGALEASGRGGPGAPSGGAEFFGGRGGFAGGRGRGGPLPEKLSETAETFYRDFDEPTLQTVPKREYQVKVESTPVRTRLFRADPKLLENKFVATFTVLAAGVDPADKRSVQQFRDRQTANDNLQRSYPDKLRALIIWSDGEHLFHQSGSYSHRDQLSLHEHFKLLVESSPPELLPAERAVAYLTSAECDRDVSRTDMDQNRRETSGPSRDEDLGPWQYKLYAPTREEAEVRVAAILRLLDAGLSRPMQFYLLTKGREALPGGREAQAALAAAKESIRAEEEKLAKPSEISADILTQLKAQKVMVAVELAGLIARVKACDDMLKDPKRLEISTLQSISDMKVKAEIERVGIKEKLDQINRFITEGDGREAANARLATLQNEVRRQQLALQHANSMAEACANVIELYAPLQVMGNQVTISPIEWTN
jgi:hypothetical protein